ncbi:MAG: SGNH/GDSL hydrolase family protein [Candidatus Magnetomorum sp.]|nr:SGNH/GDSL hydrolase family protein [Candidatus Magnetomorum sp.]
MNCILKKIKFIAGTHVMMFFCLFLLIPSIASAHKIKHIVTFGDSLSDHHGLKTYVSTAREAMTNGDVWIEYLARELNATLDNNAFIGAMTSKHINDDIQALSDTETIPQLGLIAQIDRYIDEAHTFEPSETLFTIWIGANNLIRFGMGGFPGMQPDEMITNAMTDVSNAVTKLLNIGATNYVVMTLPDIGKSPFYNWRSEEEIAGATQLSASYNAGFMHTINQLLMNKPGIAVYEFDLFQIMDEIIQKQIFPNITGSYMKLDEGFYATDETNEGPAEDYFFWDSVHPTTKAHEYFAEKVVQRILYDGFYTQQELDQAVLAERTKWDLKNDNRIGLEEAIQALKTCSGM